MQHSVDPKPIGAFIEYTMKPLIDNSMELLAMMKEQGIDPNKLLKHAAILYIFDKVLHFFLTLLVTGAICITVLKTL